jgi:hypothetical protein
VGRASRRKRANGGAGFFRRAHLRAALASTEGTAAEVGGKQGTAAADTAGGAGEAAPAGEPRGAVAGGGGTEG